MTFDEVIAAGVCAFCQLDGGALLRYESGEACARVLRYPDSPCEWHEAPVFEDPIPEAGWSHHIDCVCAFCCPEAVKPRATGWLLE
jgi:hypothetical protein